MSNFFDNVDLDEIGKASGQNPDQRVSDVKSILNVMLRNARNAKNTEDRTLHQAAADDTDENIIPLSEESEGFSFDVLINEYPEDMQQTEEDADTDGDNKGLNYLDLNLECDLLSLSGASDTPEPAKDNDKRNAHKEDTALSDSSPSIPSPDHAFFIKAGCEIRGDITLDDDIVIEGKVSGNIDSKGIIMVKGMADGILTANEVCIANTVHIKQIKASDKVTVSENVTLTGDITCSRAVLYGNVTGNVSAEKVALKSGGNVSGWIRAKQIHAEDNKIFFIKEKEE